MRVYLFGAGGDRRFKEIKMNASKFDILTLVRDASFHVSNDVYGQLLAKAEGLSPKENLGFSAVVTDVLTALPGPALANVPKFAGLSECWRATCYGGSYGEAGRLAFHEFLRCEMEGSEAEVADIQAKLDNARVLSLTT